jgi:hypothetical protein
MWMESAWLLRSVWVFLAGGYFAAKTPDYEGWISLDFLGFSRQNRDLSMSYEEITTEEFSSRFSRDGKTRRNGRVIKEMRKRRIVTGQA